jgi:hypothetical protein
VDDANAPIAGSAHYLGVVCGWPHKFYSWNILTANAMSPIGSSAGSDLSFGARGMSDAGKGE